MKKAVILHGTDGSPEHNWFPWLKEWLEGRGYEVWVPSLPNNHTPNRHTYNDFLLNSNWDFTENLIIGHSSGAVSILNLLQDERCPHIKTAVLVGVWAHMEGTDLDRDQFKDLFPESGFNLEIIKQKADKFLFIHGDDDPFCPLDQAQWLAKQLRSEIIVVPGGKHLSQAFGFSKLPQLTGALEERHFL